MVGLEDKAADVPMERSGSCHLGLGAVAVLAIRLVSYCRVRCVLRAYARPLQNPDCQTILEEIQNELGYHGPLRLMCCPAAASPMVVACTVRCCCCPGRIIRL